MDVSRTRQDKVTADLINQSWQLPTSRERLELVTFTALFQTSISVTVCLPLGFQQHFSEVSSELLQAWHTKLYAFV